MYYRVIPDNDMKEYLSRIKNPTNEFREFLGQYVTGSAWARSRGEVDTRIWGKLKGDELDAAINIILSELDHVYDEPYIRAIRYFRDPRAIPVLKRIIDETDSLAIRLIAAKVLYDWVGYDDYLGMLDEACRNTEESIHHYLHSFIDEFIEGLDSERKEYFMGLVK